MVIQLNGKERHLKFNNFALEHIVKTCANGEYSRVSEAIDSLLAQSHLRFAAIVIDACLVGEDMISGSEKSHTMQQVMEYVGTQPYAEVLSIIKEFSDSMDTVQAPAPKGTDAPYAETEKKRYRGRKS